MNEKTNALLEFIIDAINKNEEYNFATHTGDCESSIIVVDKNQKEYRIIVREEL